jgi:ATP-dependent exoDNAse (exonuclease V) beta subunit
MTIHKAKGLEFPVVVLADAARLRRNTTEAAYLLPGRGLAFKYDQYESQPLTYRLASFLDSQQSEAEEKRLLYVALTRAKEKLLISGHIKGMQGRADGWLGNLLEAGHIDVAAALDSSQPFEAATAGGYPLRAWALTPDSTTVQPAQLPDNGAEWPESTLEPLYRPLLLPEPEIEDPDPAELPRRWRAAGDRLHPPAEAVGRLVHHAIQRWLFPGSPALASVLETAALEAGLGDPVQRAEALRLAEMLLVRFQNHSLWQEIDRAEERFRLIPILDQ